MNLFRLTGDLLHLASICILIYKILSTKNCSGISLKSIELYLIVFLTRYLDLFYSFVSYYNTIMKITFILSTLYIWYLMKKRYVATYDAKNDSFFMGYRIFFLIGPCIVLALFTTARYTITEILWTFSIWLESIAIMPQLFMLTSKGEAETINTHYVATLGGYRAMYLLNWVWRYFTEGYSPYVAWVAGLIQTALYSDFFYHYVTKVMAGQKYKLPN